MAPGRCVRWLSSARAACNDMLSITPLGVIFGVVGVRHLLEYLVLTALLGKDYGRASTMNSFRKATSGTLGRCLSKDKDSKGVRGLLWIPSRADASHGIPASALSSYMAR